MKPTVRPAALHRSTGSPSRALKNEVRIIGGRWKRSKLQVLDREGLRPTPDRVRETLFNWLGQDLSGWRVLDAFAGTGALGFEAASRGAASVVCLERDAAMVKAMLAAKSRLGADVLRVEATDALTWMARAALASFDLVLLDPPFDARLHGLAVARALPLLSESGLLYVEAGERLEAIASLEHHRHLAAGRVHAHLWRKATTSMATLTPAATPRGRDDAED